MLEASVSWDLQPTDDDLFLNLSCHQGQAGRPVVPQILLLILLVDGCHIS